VKELIMELHRQGLTAPTIAAQLHLSAGNVRTTIHAAGKALHLASDRAVAAQRRTAIEDALTINPSLTSKDLAERLNVPRPCVTRIRKRLGRPATDRHARAQSRRSNVALELLAGLTVREIATKYGVRVQMIQSDRRVIEAGG
jgi:DNA-binding NarL/FixJ family response regulator